MVDKFIASKDDFLDKAGYTIGVFYSQINKLQTGGKAGSLVDRERRLGYVSRKKPENV